MGERINARGLFEAARLMQTAADLGGDVRQDLERKAVQTFWRSVGFSEAADTNAGGLLAPGPGVRLVPVANRLERPARLAARALPHVWGERAFGCE